MAGVVLAGFVCSNIEGRYPAAEGVVKEALTLRGLLQLGVEVLKMIAQRKSDEEDEEV